ncbi:MAG: hypothetical protein IIU58_01800, partial [Clostridia bacterium]|nr:hypothetical protein [Clostridia bacterium]
MPEQLFTEPVNEQLQNETASAPYALPPPAHAPSAQANQSQRHIAQRFVCIFCAMIAVSALLLCALQKLDEILSRGFWQYLGEELLCTADSGQKTLGDRMSESAFGDLLWSDAEKADIIASLQVPSILPRIYYIPKEQIADEIYFEKEQL